MATVHRKRTMCSGCTVHYAIQMWGFAKKGFQKRNMCIHIHIYIYVYLSIYLSIYVSLNTNREYGDARRTTPKFGNSHVSTVMLQHTKFRFCSRTCRARRAKKDSIHGNELQDLLRNCVLSGPRPWISSAHHNLAGALSEMLFFLLWRSLDPKPSALVTCTSSLASPVDRLLG